MNQWLYPIIAAHRGGGKLAPENTIAAILTGAFYGHRMVEFDVKLSKDNVVFLLHDDTLDRTSTGSGLAADMLYSDIAQFDAGSWLHPRFRREYMPTLGEILPYCITHHIIPNIEIKPSLGREVETGRLVALEAQKCWHTHSPPPLFSSYSLQALQTAKEAVPDFPRGILFDQVPNNWEALAGKLACLSLHINHRYLTEALAKQIKNAGYSLFVFTVNELQEARKLRQWGVDCICTDQIDLLTPHTL